MKSIVRRSWALAPFLVLAVTACSDSTTEPRGYTTDELTTELAISPDHVHAFENEVTFTVSVVDPDGAAVTDFDVVQVERRLSGAANWSTMEATLQGDFYVVTHVFEASGEYDIRVTGLRPSDTQLVVLYEQATPLHAVRAHAEVGGYRVEGEPDPGHIHEGNTANVRFWILDDVTRDGITGLTPSISVVHSVAGTTQYAASEGAGGLYEATHTFTEIGATSLTIEFIGTDQQTHEWTLEVEVHAAH
ncbi:MAG TPA: hypothetical protein VLA09_00180 [Longimicrobiales bacterium]|nr:hypothetical protein [Longimicrobiales bacterium]